MKKKRKKNPDISSEQILNKIYDICRYLSQHEIELEYVPREEKAIIIQLTYKLFEFIRSKLGYARIFYFHQM